MGFKDVFMKGMALQGFDTLSRVNPRLAADMMDDMLKDVRK